MIGRIAGARHRARAALSAIAAVVAIAELVAPAAGSPAPGRAATRPARLPSGAVMVRDAWVRAMVPGTSVAAAYLTLANPSEQPVILVRARSREARAVEFHQTLRRGDHMEMRPLPRVVVPARGTAIFAPGGSHIMLIGVHRMLRAGMSVPMTLKFSNGDSLLLKFPVR